MKGTELLKLDFSKYEKVLINNVILYSDEIKAEESEDGKSILITGYKNNEHTFFTSYKIDEDIEITENKEVSILAIRKN